MTKKIGIYRRWSEDPPIGSNGQPIPESEWPKRRKHTWEVRWFLPSGKRRSKCFKRKGDAEQFANEKSVEFDRTPTARNEPTRMTLGEWRDAYLKLRQDKLGRRLSEAAVIEASSAFRRLVDFFGEDRIIQDIEPAEALRFTAHLRTQKTRSKGEKSKAEPKPLAIATINKFTRTTKAIFENAVEQGLLRVNPFSKIRQVKQAQSPKRYLTEGEYLKLIKAIRKSEFDIPEGETREAHAAELRREANASDADKAKELLETARKLEVEARDAVWFETLLVTLYTSGLRLKEALFLTWADVDFEANTVAVNPKPDDGVLIPWQPKDREARQIPVPAETCTQLAKLQGDADGRSPYVFISPERLDRIQDAIAGGTWRETSHVVNGLQRRWAAIVTRAGIQPVTFHDLRRTYLTNVARRLPVNVVREVAGHSKVETTLEYYLSTTASDRKAIRQASAPPVEKVTQN